MGSSATLATPRVTVSVILTLRNRAKFVDRLIGSIFQGSRKPDELIVVDGGSSDGTPDMVRNHALKAGGVTLKVIERPCNRAQGRNIAIAEATGSVIAVTDGGCWVDKDWLRLLLEPFEKDPSVQVVGGNFVPLLHSAFERALGVPMFQRPLATIERSPSSRSIAFKKEVWRLVGGYPEEMIAGEDTEFNIRWRKIGANYVFQPDAIVYRQGEGDLGTFLQRSFRHAQGDGEGHNNVGLRVRPIVAYLAVAFLLSIAAKFHPYWLVGLVPLVAFIVFRSAKSGHFRGKGPGGATLVVAVLLLAHSVGTLGFLKGLALWFGRSIMAKPRRVDRGK